MDDGRLKGSLRSSVPFFFRCSNSKSITLAYDEIQRVRQHLPRRLFRCPLCRDWLGVSVTLVTPTDLIWRGRRWAVEFGKL